MLTTIGNTPVVRLQRIVPSGSAQVWVKLETSHPNYWYFVLMALLSIAFISASMIS